MKTIKEDGTINTKKELNAIISFIKETWVGNENILEKFITVVWKDVVANQKEFNQQNFNTDFFNKWREERKSLLLISAVMNAVMEVQRNHKEKQTSLDLDKLWKATKKQFPEILKYKPMGLNKKNPIGISMFEGVNSQNVATASFEEEMSLENIQYHIEEKGMKPIEVLFYAVYAHAMFVENYNMKTVLNNKLEILKNTLESVEDKEKLNTVKKLFEMEKNKVFKEVLGILATQDFSYLLMKTKITKKM